MQRAFCTVRKGVQQCTADGSAQMTDTIEAEMKVSPFRRWFSSGLVALTAALLLNMAMTTPPAGILIANWWSWPVDARMLMLCHPQAPSAQRR